MDYKKIFNESNLEKQEESKMRLNECGGYGGCGYSWAPDPDYVTYSAVTIYNWLNAEPEFANVDRKYMKGWCQRNTYGKRGKNYFVKKFRDALRDKEAREQKSAEKKANKQALMSNFDLTEDQIKAAKAAQYMDREVETNKEAVESAQQRYEDSLAQQEKLWNYAGGKELWDEILANGYKLN